MQGVEAGKHNHCAYGGGDAGYEYAGSTVGDFVILGSILGRVGWHCVVERHYICYFWVYSVTFSWTKEGCFEMRGCYIIPSLPIMRTSFSSCSSSAIIIR